MATAARELTSVLASDDSQWRWYRSRNVVVYLTMTTVLLVMWSFSFGGTFDAYLLELARSQGRADPNVFVGSLESVRGTVTLAFALPLGWMADKFSRRRMLQGGTVIATGGILFLAIGIATDSIKLIYVGTIIAALFMQVFSSAGTAFLADIVPRSRLTEVMALQSSLYLIGYSMGPLAQAIMVIVIGDTWRLSILHVALCGGFAIWPIVLLVSMKLEKTPSELDGEMRQSLTASADQAAPAPEAAAVAPPDDWRSERVFGIRKKWFVPLLIEFRSVITAIGAGMTVKFFPLFFKQEYNFEPLAVNILGASYTLSVAIFVQLCRKVSTGCGRCQASLAWQICGISGLFALWQAKPLALCVFWYILRGSFMNASGPIDSSVIMDCVDPQHRGRWAALQSISRFSWSGSAVLGGLIADRHGYRYTFFITGIIYAVAAAVYVPLLWLVPAHASAPSDGATTGGDAATTCDTTPGGVSELSTSAESEAGKATPTEREGQ